MLSALLGYLFYFCEVLIFLYFSLFLTGLKQWECPKKTEQHTFSDKNGPTKRSRTLITIHSDLFLFQVPFVNK